MSWGVDSGVATTEAMRRERQKEDNIVSVGEVTVRKQVAVRRRDILFPTALLFAFVCPLWLTLLPSKLPRHLVCITHHNLTRTRLPCPSPNTIDAEFSGQLCSAFVHQFRFGHSAPLQSRGLPNPFLCCGVPRLASATVTRDVI